MKILVSTKPVLDYKAVVRLKSDGSGIETSNISKVMNPFDAIAVEEAVRMKEKGLATEIIAAAMGGDACQEILRTALAMGADRAIHIKSEIDLQPLAVAKILKKLAEQENPELIILGKQAVDTDDNQVGQMLAGLLNWPQATFASQLDYQATGLQVTREIDGGLEILLLTLPAVVTTDLRLNEPRYLSLPNIVKAKQKPLINLPIETFNIDIVPRFKMVKMTIPEKKRAGIRLENVTELVKQITQVTQ